MANVLIVDDEREYREELYMALARAGHDVMTRGNGGAAIDLGIRMRPDVLIVDWMLKDSVDGLNVCDVLRTIDPRTKVIVMTGFASRDLREQSVSRSIAGFLDKPFEMDEVIAAVARAVESIASPAVESEPVSVPFPVGGVPLGVLELNQHWDCTYINPAAKVLAGMSDEDLGTPLIRHFRIDAPTLDRSHDRWVDVELVRQPGKHCSVRVREWEELDIRFIFLLDAADADRQHHPITHLALNQQTPRANIWKFDAHALVLDPHPVERLGCVEALRDAGCSCHGAVDIAEALRLLKRDRKLRLLIVDDRIFDADDSEMLLAQLEASRPGVLTIGTSRGFDRDRFFQRGVEYYLQKPWEPSDLIGLLKAESVLTRGE